MRNTEITKSSERCVLFPIRSEWHSDDDKRRQTQWDAVLHATLTQGAGGVMVELLMIQVAVIDSTVTDSRGQIQIQFDG